MAKDKQVTENDVTPREETMKPLSWLDNDQLL